MAEIQKYNRQTNQLSIHYFTKKIMDLGVLFLPNSIKKYLTTPPTKNEISHVQHHQRTTPYTLNLPASFMIHKVWISFQVYKWPRTAVDKNYGSLHKKVRFHIYSFLPFLANPWKWADKDYVARFQQFNVAQLANYFTVGVLYKVVTYSSWRISFVHAIAHKPAASCMIISILRYGRVNITSKSSFNRFKIDSQARPTANCYMQACSGSPQLLYILNI